MRSFIQRRVSIVLGSAAIQQHEVQPVTTKHAARPPIVHTFQIQNLYTKQGRTTAATTLGSQRCPLFIYQSPPDLPETHGSTDPKFYCCALAPHHSACPATCVPTRHQCRSCCHSHLLASRNANSKQDHTTVDAQHSLRSKSATYTNCTPRWPRLFLVLFLCCPR